MASNVFLSCFAVLLFAQAVASESTDATKSTATGNGLQYATAGVQASFTVTAKDESGVRRTSGGDEFIVELEGTRSISGSVVDNLDGSYDVTYTPTKSGNYEAGVKLAKSGGLTGQYFENVWFFYTPVKTTVNPTIDLDWGLGAVTDAGMDYVSVRWQGKVKPLFAETHTFYISSDDGAKLWVDNVVMIDRWDSTCNETSATIALKPHVFYNIKLEYKEVTGAAFVRMSWSSQSTPKEIVPASQLYYETHIKQSPFSFIVSPSVAVGSHCWAVGEGLALATAGTSAQLTLQANDVYDNERGEGGDLFTVRVFPPNSIEKDPPEDGRPVHAMVVDEGDSSYISEYTQYVAGNNTLYATLLKPGGISATYYDGVGFTDPMKYAEGTNALQKLQFKETAASNNEFSIPTIDGFSVRWVGHIAPVQDATYTFTWDMKNTTIGDRVRLWVDNSMIIQQWSSLDTLQVDPSGTIDLRASYFYDVKVDYKVSSGGATFTAGFPELKWAYPGTSSTTIPTSNLFVGQDVMDTPTTVFVHPAGTCAAKSFTTPNQQAAGHSLELATAGLQSEFTITAKDLYGNLRCVGAEKFKVRLTGVDSLAGVVEDLTDSSPGTYRVLYTATKSGTYDVSVVFGASGVQASPFRLTVQPARRHLINSPTTGQALTLSTAGVLSTVTITVRDRHENYQPDPAVALAGIQFSAADAEAPYAPTLTNQAILQTADKPAFADQVSYIGDATLAGKQIATPTSLDNPRLILRYTITKSGKYSLNVGGNAASHESAVMGAPFDLTIYPHRPCSVTSTAAGLSLSIATAGIRSTFTIQARDMYGNERGWHVGDNFVARVRQYYGTGATDNVLKADRNKECAGRTGVTDADGNTDAICENWMTYNSDWVTVGGRDKQGTVVDQGDGTYVVSYDVTRSGTNYVWASLAVAGGLQATYYTSDTDAHYLSDSTIYSAEATKRIVQTDTTVDFSVTSSSPRIHGTAGAAGVLLDDTWAARWTGLVKPSETEVYTFYAGGDVSGTDKKERVKLWVDNSLIIQQWSSLASASAPSGSIKLEKDNYYEVLLAAKTDTADTTNTAKMQLKWSSFTHRKSLISSSRLFVSHHISNSPFPLQVEQSDTCSATSRVYNAGLSVATAGIVASFTVQGRDSYDNKRLFHFNDGLGREYEWALVANASLPEADLNLQNSIVDGGEAAYQGTVEYLNAGGYQVNYTATRAEKYNIRGRMLSSGGIYGTYFENEDLSDHATAPDGSLSFVKPFERFDNEINFAWGLGRPIGAVTNGTADVLDSGILLSGDTVLPYDQVTLDPNTASDIAEAYVGKRLLINGEERTITTSTPASNTGTAGAASTASILQLASGASTADHFYVGYTAKVYNASDNSFETRLITKYEGSNLTATLESPLDYGQADNKAYAVEGARVLKVSAPYLLPIVTGSKYVVADTTNSKDIGPDYFSARWEGMVKVKYSEVYTFSVYCDDGAKLYINDLLILDHWYSRISEVDGTVAMVAGSMYPLKLEYKQVTGNASVQLRWRSRSQAKEIVPKDALYSWTTTHALSNSNGSVYVEPAKVCSSTSTAFGKGLSAATAGVAAYFTIQARDEYMNNRKTADSGIRPGEPGSAKLVNYGTLNFITATQVTLDTSTLDEYPPGASTVEHAYKGFRLYLDGKDHHDEYRTIIDYGVDRKATLDAPFTTISSGSVAYKVIDLISPNEPAMAGFRDGYPEFHTRVQPLVDGGDSVLHHAPMRLSSAQYPGGLTATYYDEVTTTESFKNGVANHDWSLNNDILSKPRWATQCSSGRPCDYTIDFSESAKFKRKQYGADCGVEWAGKVNEGVTGAATTKYDANLDSSTAMIEDNAYLDHYILFLDGTCRGRWAKITQYPTDLTTAVGMRQAKLDLGAATWSDGSAACLHGSGDAYEIYQGATIGGKGPINKPLFPRSCKGGTELTRGWKVYEPSENPTASLSDTMYAVRWSGMISASAAGVYTFFADLPTATDTGATDDRVKLWIDNSVVIQHWSSLGSINGARTGTFSFDTHPSMHTISVHYKNKMAGTSGLRIRWQSQAAGHRQAFTSALSGLVPPNISSCNSGVYTAEYCRLGSAIHGDGAASSQVDNLYNMQYIKFTAGGNCNGRWTRIGAGGASDYEADDSCVKFSSTTWEDGSAGCTCVPNDQYKLIEWLGLPGTVGNRSGCVNEGHATVAPLTAQVDLSDTTISLKPSDVTAMKIVADTYVRINDEILKVTGVSAGTLTVTREQTDTTKTVHLLGSSVYALSKVALEDAAVPSPGTSFASHIILFTTGSCKGRWANITIYDNSAKCASLGGTNLGGGYNWLDGKGACTAAQGDKYLIKFGISGVDTDLDGILEPKANNKTGAAGALSTENWLTTVGSLQAHSDDCPLGAKTVHLGTAAPKRDDDFANHYIRFSSGTCNNEWARIVSYDGAAQCATLEWESLGSGAATGQKTSVTPGLAMTGDPGLTSTNITELDTLISVFSYVQNDLGIVAGSYVKVDSEIMLVTGIVSSTQIMVQRAQEGTAAVRHTKNTTLSVVGLRCTYGDTYTIGLSAGGPVVPSSRLFPLASRYETTFTPTIKGDYQVHSSLAQGSGLDATFYDDQELTVVKHTRVDETLNFTVVEDEVGYHGDNPRSLESKLSDRLSFSVRWAGLLQLDDHIDDSTPQQFTFESGIAETDERVKLWVDNSLIIDRWETYDHLSATTFSATIALSRPNYYDLKMEYKQYAGSHAQAVLKWHCGIAGSACEQKSIIPSSNLFQIREVADSPFPPFTVEPAPTCAARSTLEGPGLSTATAGVPAGFTIQAIDEYNNDRGEGGDAFVVRAVPFNTWNKMEPFETTRTTKDCLRCPQTIFGSVKDLDDSTYEAEFTGTKRGHYKVLTSLALEGGLYATYYAGAPGHAATPGLGDQDDYGPTSHYPKRGISAFHRSGQTGNSEHDFVSPCLLRSWKNGVPLSTYECASPDYDWTDSDVELSGVVQAGSMTSITLDSTASSDNDFYNGMHIALYGAKGAGTVRVITDYVGSTKVASVATMPEAPDAPNQQYWTSYKIVGSKVNRNSGWIKGGFAVGGNATSIRLPASGSWSHFDTEPYSATIHSPLDGTGQVRSYDSVQTHGGISCPLGAARVRLGAEAAGEDDAYTDRYIKFTSGTCKGRWTKIEDYVGPGATAKITMASHTTSDVYLPSGLNQTDHYYNSSTICVVGGTSKGECRIVVSHATASNNYANVTVTPAFSTALDTTSVIKIIGDSKCAMLKTPWSDGYGGSCTPAAGDGYKLTGGWQVVITAGKCKGQYKRVANYHLEDALDTHSNQYGYGGVINVDSPWDTSSRANGYGPYGEKPLDGETETISYNYDGCTAPDNTSEYVLVPAQKAPGSIHSVDNTFGVRWAGFVKPTSATEYTFLVQMPNAAAGQERIKLWLDNKIVIDQWTSLAGCLPSATVAFAGSSSMLYDLQMEYKRMRNSPLPPRVKLTWLNSLGGQEVAPGPGGAGDAASLSSSRLFTNIAVPNDDLVMYVDPAATESRASSVSGKGLTTATAGIQASFTITSRDEYANLRDLDEDSYIVKVDGPTASFSVSPEPILDTPGTYGVTHLPTESGDYTVSVERAQPGGLASEWFNNMWLMGEAADSTVSEEIDYDWGKEFVTFRPKKETKTGNDYVSVRWTGYFKAELTEVYTFHAVYQDGLVMHLDSKKVIDNWEGVNTTGVDTTSPDYVEPTAEARATLSATAGHMYPITIEYREVQANASCKIYYSSASITHTIVPSSRLYHTATHAFGSPFKLYVNPAVTCGPQSGIVGAGLSYATAGMQAAFTIQARDIYENTKTKWEDTFVVRSAATASIAPDALGEYGTAAWSALSKHGTISADVTKGRYVVRYTPTAAADVTIFSSLVVQGGVFATYYDGVSPTYYNEPLKAGRVTRVEAVSAGGIFATYYDAVNAESPIYQTVPSVASYTVRWSGLFRPEVATTHTFKPFGTGRSDQSDRVKLWMDSKLIIDQWTSLAAALPTATLSFPAADEYYELQMYYRAHEIMAFGTLQADTGSGYANINSNRLFMSTHVEGSPFAVNTQPAPTDFSTSIIYGEGLTIGTAGVSASFSVQAKDSFNNLRLQGGDGIQAQLASVGTGAVVNPKVVDNGDGTYTGSFMPTTQGLYDLSVFLGSSVKTTAVLVEPGDICSANSYSNGLSLTVATAGHTATFTIQSKDAFKNLRTIGTDNFVVRLSGPGTEEHNVRSEYIGIAPNSNLGRYTVSFRATQSGDFNIAVHAATANGLSVKYFRDLELQQAADEATVDQLDFDVGDQTSNANVAVTDGFSVLWSGFVKPTSSEEYTFHTKIAEVDERVKLWVDDQWIVDQWTSLSGTAPTGTLWLAGNILYDLKVQYKEIAGHSAASLHWESSSTSKTLVPSSNLFRSASPVEGSPFAATVFPARTSGTISTGTGLGLSLATAGTAASFTVQAKDHLGNLKTTTDDIFVVRAKFNGKHSYPTTTPFTNGGVAEQSRNRVGTVVNVGPGQYEASYIATWKRNHLSDDGWEVDTATSSKAGHYGDLGPSGIKKKYHDVLISQALQGGLMATYYSSIPSSHNSGPWSSAFTQEPWDSPYRTKLTPTVQQEAAAAGDFAANVCVDDVHTFGIRYAGFVSPPLAQRYTFEAHISDPSSDTTERVRLWIDNVLVIDQWASLSATNCGSGGGCFSGTLDFSTANTHHDLVLEYKESATASNTKAKIELHYGTGATGVGDKLEECVAAMGSAACASCQGHACTYNGATVLIPSARLYQRHDLSFNIFQSGGLTATYYDQIPSSSVTVDGGVASVRVAGSAHVSGSPYNTTCLVGCLRPNCPGSGFTCTCVVTAGTVSSVTVNTPGSGYSALNPPLVNCANGTGQSFFVELDYAGGHVGGALTPKKAVVEPTVDWSGVSATDRPYPDSVTDGQFSVRWMGFVKPSRTDQYTFYVPLSINGATKERVRLWVDNQVIIDSWTSLGTADPSGTLSFPVGDEYYNIQLDYKSPDTADQASRGLRLEWQNYADRLPNLYGEEVATESEAVSRGVIRSDRLMQALVTSEIHRDDRHIWDTDYHSSESWVFEDRNTPRTNQWAKTNGCPSTSGTSVRGVNLRYAECRGLGTRTNDVLRVDVRAAALCASTSNVLGVALTISTAGITRTFTLTARDAYDNQRDSTDDSFIARAVLNDMSDPNRFHGSLTHQSWETLKNAPNSESNNPVWDQNGKYEITYAISRSGTFQHTIKELDTAGNGLWGSYFRGRTLDQKTDTETAGELMASQQDSNLAFDWGTALAPMPSLAVGSEGWSARWTGYVRPKYSDLYTFSVLSDGGVRVYVDGVSVISDWTSTTEVETSGEIVLTGGIWYDIQVEYVPAPTPPAHEAKLKLSWSSPQQVKEMVPSDRLRFSPSLVGPESATGAPNGGFNILDVHPTVVCAAASDIRGAGLSIATAGISASFTVWSKDMYGNLRDDTNDLLMARMFPDDAVTETGVIYGGIGLQATYYDRIGQNVPLKAVSSGATIDFSNSAGLVSSTGAYASGRTEALSIRWAGLVRPGTAGGFTFHTALNTASQERFKMWVDNSLLIDQWTSLAATDPSASLNVTANKLYPLKITYKNPSPNTAARLQLKYEATGTSETLVKQTALYPCEHVSGLNSDGGSCDSDSKIQTQTTNANTAEKLDFGDSSTSVAFGLRRLTPTTTGPAPERNGPFVTKLWNGNSAFAPFQGNRRPFSYVQTRAGSHTLVAQEVAYDGYDGDDTFAASVGTGLMATYYETPAFGTPRNSYDCQQGRTLCNTNNVDFSTSGLQVPFSLIADGSFSVRWAGMMRAPDTTNKVTLTAEVGDAGSKDERVKLWIDNSLLIDQWSSLSEVGGNVQRTAAPLDLNANQLYDIKIEYKNVVAGSTDGSKLKMSWAWQGGSTTVVPSNKLYSSHTISGSAKRVRVNPAVAFSPACEVHGLGLTLSTAGIQATFLIQSKDAYNNRRGIGGDLFVVRAFSDGCQTLNPGRDVLCDGFSGTTAPDGSALADAERSAACSDTAMCAPYPPQVASNGPNLLGDLIPGGSYLGEVKGISIAEPTSKKFLYASADPSVTLHRGELSEDGAYVGATLTLTGAGCGVAGESKEIVAYTGATRKATLDGAFSADPAGCGYKITNSTTVIYLDDAASPAAGTYDHHRIRFLTGPCIDRWTTVKSYSGLAYRQDIDLDGIDPGPDSDVAGKAAMLEAKTTSWLAGNVLSQTSATTFTLGAPAVNTSQNYRGMWITVRDSLGNAMGTSKIANFSEYPGNSPSNSGTATVSPALSAASGAATYVIHGWDDGGRPCENYGWGAVELIPPNCDRIVDEGVFTAVTDSVIALKVTTAGDGYTAGGGAFNVVTGSGGGGTGLAGYCTDATPGDAAGEIVITNGGSGYTSCPTIECPGHSGAVSAGTTHTITCTLGASGVTLGNTASLTADAYQGYYLSVDGTGERRKISSYTTSRVATVVEPFTDRPTAGDRYTVRGCTGDAGAMLCPNCPRVVRADVVDNGDSTYSASFTATRKGQYSVVTSLVNAGGVTATYYDSLSSSATNDFGAGKPVSSVVDATVDWSAVAADSKPSASLTNEEFAVRWVGFVRPSRAQQYTFHMQMAEANNTGHSERVKLWVDNSIVIQQWSSLASEEPSGTIAFGRANGYYDISALYKCAPASTEKCGYSLKWESTVSGVANLDASKARIRSDRLFQRLDVPNMPSGLHVQPAITCAAESVAYRAGLTLATAGVDASFTIQSKDAYENLREDTSAAFTLSIHGSGGTPVYAGNIIADAPSTAAQYTSSYNLQNAKGYEVFVKHGNENVKGSPFSLVVKPAWACGSRSTVQGTGLTASALSPAKSAFTIQARDMYGNARTQAAPSGSEYVVRVVRTSGTNQQGTNGLPPFYGSTAHEAGGSGTLHGIFNSPTNDGRFAGYYQVPPTPNPATLNHYLYTSYVHKGGITATYYTTPDDGATLSAPVDADPTTPYSDLNRHVAVIGANGAGVSNANNAANNLWGTGKVAATDVEFVVRFNGLYKNVNQTAKYFKWDSAASNTDRVKLWVDNVLIIDQWTSLANATQSAAYTFDNANGLYDVHLEWKREPGATNTTTAALKDSSDNSAFADITSDRLYYQEEISGSPYAVSVSS